MASLIKIAICNNKTEKRYKNQEWSWSDIKKRNSNPIRTCESVKEYPRLSKARRDQLKDQGGFVGGWLKEGIRKNGNITFRTLGTLDADNISNGEEFLAIAQEALKGFDYFIYSTHSHSLTTPRYRIVIRFSRDVSEEEYPALMRLIAKELGMDYFDDTTYQANRMMYWASCPKDAEFFFKAEEGNALVPDGFLSRLANWRDITQWPTSSRESEVALKALSDKQMDPLLKDGIVGSFCRAYSIEEAIEKFLPNVYAPSVMTGRYDYILGEGTAGVVIYDGKFAYSHHATDPACSHLLNAFDLVRVHKFYSDDEKKSYDQMANMASLDEKVKIEIFNQKSKMASQEFSNEEDWRVKLRYTPKTNMLENCVYNLSLILENDPDFQGFAFNELSGRVQVIGSLPWDRPTGNTYWRDADTAQLKAIIDVRYLPFSTRNHDVAFAKVADDRHFHPIRDYLDSLPPWDGECRVEELFIKYLKAEDNEYVRAVTRKTFAATVARIYNPGTKFDSVPVLDGAQGIGKSTIVKDLVGSEYYSESLALTDMNDKAACEKLQGFWVIEIGELAGMKKADIEKVKSFLSTTDDKYRPSYGRSVESHPRQCVIIATVNGERGYLRDITGNRRFWIIKLNKREQGQAWHFSSNDRDQFWAEAKQIWLSGEKLYLQGTLLEKSEDAQRDAMEADDRVGMVETYLDTLLPEDWNDMDMYERRDFLANYNSPMAKKGVTQRTLVSNAEVWCECFGHSLSDLKTSDSFAIAALLSQLDEWERTNSIQRQKIYGRQRVYRRKI